MKKRFKLLAVLSAAAVILLIVAGVFVYSGCETGYSDEIQGSEEAVLTTAPNVPPPITRDHPTKVIVHLFKKEES